VLTIVLSKHGLEPSLINVNIDNEGWLLERQTYFSALVRRTHYFQWIQQKACFMIQKNILYLCVPLHLL
jgi:hypothetical protein